MGGVPCFAGAFPACGEGGGQSPPNEGECRRGARSGATRTRFPHPPARADHLLPRAGEGRGYAALASLAFSWAKAQSSQRVSASMSAVDRRAAPDAQAGRGVAIAADVEGDLLLLQRAGERLGESRLASAGSAVTSLSTTFRQTLVLERVNGTRARKSTHGVLAAQSAIALALASARANRPFSPPTLLADRSASISPRRTTSRAC